MSFVLLFEDFIYLFVCLFRERGREREREEEKHRCEMDWLRLTHAPTGNQACNPGMCPDWESNW